MSIDGMQVPTEAYLSMLVHPQCMVILSAPRQHAVFHNGACALQKQRHYSENAGFKSWRTTGQAFFLVHQGSCKHTN